MKIRITAAENTTKWYKITRDQLMRGMTDHDNIWVQEVLSSNEPLQDILNFDSDLYGSFVEDDSLYYLVTNDDYIIIGDDETVVPEDAYEDYGFNALSGYIVNDEPNSIVSQISGDDFAWNTFDIEEIAKSLLDVESFQEVVDSADDLNIIIR